MTVSVTTASLIVSISLIAISFTMLLLVLNFYRLRHLKEIASRRPTSSLLAGILCTLGNFIVYPSALLYLNNKEAPYIPWMGTLIHLGLMLSSVGPYHIFTFRAYMVYFDIKFNAILEDKKWRLYIDPEETNWFLKHRHTFGNQKRVALAIFIHWIILTIAILTVVVLNHHRGNDISRYLFAVACIDPMLIDIYLYCRFPKFNDIWGIHNEIKLTLRAEIIQQLIYFVLVLALKLEYYTMNYVYTFVMVGATSFLFVMIIHWRVFRVFKLPSLPCVSINWITDRDHIERLNSSKPSELSSGSDLHKNIDLESILQDKHGFNEFARHLTKEFCIENLLFFVEMQQWKQSLIEKEEYSGFEVSDMMEIKFPENAPKSRIIVSDHEVNVAVAENDTESKADEALPSDEEYVQVIALFKKYIPTSAYFALNISSKNRNILYRQFVFDDSFQMKETEMINPLKKSKMDRKTLYHLFDATRTEIYCLLVYAFVRFKETDTFPKLLGNMTSVSLQ